MEKKRLDIAVPGLVRHATAFRLHDDGLHQAARGPIYAGAPPVDAMMEIAVNSDDALGQAARVLTGLSDRLAGVIRPADCAVVAGSSHDILPGAGPVHLAICGSRLPHLDHKDRKSTRLNSITNAQLVCRLLLENKKTTEKNLQSNSTQIL